jgi:hypothetical protein
MRATTWVIIAIAGSLAGHEAARSADAPKFVIPGKPGVPVIINGYDASYSIVEGDWGLDRPTGVPPAAGAAARSLRPRLFSGRWRRTRLRPPRSGAAAESAAAASRAAISSQLGH